MVEFNSGFLVGISLLAAATMGLAIQRGATCMVAAVDEAYSTKTFGRARALAEASLWVAGPITFAALLGFATPSMNAFPAGSMALAGGLLLGFGALVNSACVFGSIARIGSGNWHYFLTPPGFFLGSWLHSALAFDRTAVTATPLPEVAELAIVGLFLSSLLPRLVEFLGAARRRTLLDHVRQPQIATIAIGLTFVVLLLTAGPWAYTQVLDQLAHGGMGFGSLEFALFVALFAGAIAGGWRGRIAFVFDFQTALKCLSGGAMMGFGSALIPGGNDNLILSGIPALQSYAWVAISAMVFAIWTGLIVSRNWRKWLRLPQQGNRSRS